jgi:prepilin-type N-terminal cleavage/methylation domain-containing protein
MSSPTQKSNLSAAAESPVRGFCRCKTTADKPAESSAERFCHGEAVSCQKGLSLIEVLVTVAIISLLSVGIFSLIILSLRVTADNQYYVEAIEIANQKIEQIRNMPYDEIGVVGGIPGGDIPQVETISRAGNFTVNSFVSFYDDPYDGTAGNGDTIINDYKIATVKVGWQGKYEPGNVTVFSKVIPRTEETAAGYGLLKISVTNANAEPLPGANVRVVNNALIPAVDVINPTNANGILYLPALASFQGYEITVTKTDYGTDETYGLLTGKSPAHLSVTESNKTEENFSIDKLAHLQIRTAQNSLPENWRVSQPEGTRDMINTNFSIDGSDNIYFAWENYTATSSYIYAQKYNSAGTKQWANDYIINNVDSQNNPDIVVSDSGNSFVVWSDNSVGDENIYIVSLDADGDERWAAKKVNGDSGVVNQENPKIAITSDSATTTVVWQDERNGNIDIYAQSFGADGNKLWVNDLQVSSSANNELSPALAFSDNNIIIVWVEDGAVDKNIYAQKFNLNGNNIWGANINIAGESYDEYSPAITADNSGNFYLSWTEDNAGALDVKIAKYDSTGARQWFGSANLNFAADQYDSALAAGDSYLYCSWTDDRDGDINIYAQKYDLNGNIQWLEDFKISISLTGGSQLNSILATNSVNENFAAWQDNRDGDYNIYATEFNDPTSLSGVGNVPIRVHGTQTISETPVIYEFDQTVSTDANGYANLTLEWDAGYTLELFPPTAYEIKYINPPSPLGILPDETKEWVVYVE